MDKKLLTLCIVHEPERVLLGFKKRGFGAGRWNGFGGKLAPQETIEQAVRREVQEEAGIEPGPLEKVGIISFINEGHPNLLEVHIFRTASFIGEPVESEEMRPQWFAVQEIPFDEMWPDDRHWLPLLLAGKKFRGHFEFDAAGAIAKQELQEVADLEEVL